MTSGCRATSRCCSATQLRRPPGTQVSAAATRPRAPVAAGGRDQRVIGRGSAHARPDPSMGLLAESEHQLPGSFERRPCGPWQLMPGDVDNSIPAADIPDPPGTEPLLTTPCISPFMVDIGDDWLEDALIGLS